MSAGIPVLDIPDEPKAGSAPVACKVCGLITDNKRHCCPPIQNPAPVEKAGEVDADRAWQTEREALTALRSELAAKDEKLRGLDYLYGELGNQNSFLRAELAEARAEIERLGGLTNLHTVQLSEGRAELAAEKAAREKAEAERDELALLTVPSDDDAQVAVRMRIAEERVEELENEIVSWRGAQAVRFLGDAGDRDAYPIRREAEIKLNEVAASILAARSAKGEANG